MAVQAARSALECGGLPPLSARSRSCSRKAAASCRTPRRFALKGIDVYGAQWPGTFGVPRSIALRFSRPLELTLPA
jgi:hypothetical protein